ncbi:acetate--CoA ligase [Candidatus Gottesmanbacteria bacterium RIFCSPHIGHO2_02_FULL_40_13]|uniref:acetate--CoA ligase n=1 Tax=Candidatus Gottesmanbacteria bacterium RIFCSPHIGHO2_02_FULL_40_13 TaxID=1798384 RepID=A0A1F6A6E4_9BACT|nr:MAG: acetate--CoA ligase [Candidatus Gottesmanbacteria bacterium RIFCSPHIGHO2_02_FULL_40_13]
MDIYKKNKTLFKLAPNLADYDKVYKDFDWEKVYGELEWFEDHKINAAYNAVDRHLKTHRKNKVALFFEDEKGDKQKYTFEELANISSKIGNYLKTLGVDRGDRVFIFLPRIPYLYFSFLAVLKIGAIAGTLFSAFYEDALFDRLENSQAKILITNSDLAQRLKTIRHKLPHLQKIVLVDDPKFQTEVAKSSESLHIAHMDPDDYAFMLYTSGTTGKPKGVVHRHLAILSQHLTAKYVLDLHDEDTYWCTADPGWVTGIAYEILGSWSCGVTSVVYSGRFDPQRWYQILQDYKVNVWYTAPTAVRMLMASGTQLVKKYNLGGLRHLLSVGEPLNPEAVRWGIEAFGRPFHDTWWQTETGAICIANYPVLDIKIGSMGKPVPGLIAGIIDDKGNEMTDGMEGNLALKKGWPSMMKTIWHRHVKYESYFVKDWYVSGDRAWKDKDGYFWFIGRADDVIKTSGERVGPYEVESALVEHPAVIEAGVIGKPDALRGEIIKAFVVLKPQYSTRLKDLNFLNDLKEELSRFVKKHLAGHAYPREIEFVDKLPKTRSGKIMRRILKAREMGLPVGDTSTLEEY